MVTVLAAMYQILPWTNSHSEASTTPKTYLELIQFYKDLLGHKSADLEAQKNRLLKGIRTLKKTGADVAELKENLKDTLEKVK